MSEVSINITMDEELRDSLVNTKTIPAEDPFYSVANIRRLERAANDVRSGKALLTQHELIATE